MRAVVRVSDDPTEWFEKLEPQSLRHIIAQVRRNVILKPTTFGKRSLRQALSNLDEASKELISNYIQEVPMAPVGKDKEEDKLVGLFDTSLSTFESEIIDIIEISERRSELATTQEDCSSVYQRTIGVLASLANRVEVYDKYSSASLLKNKSWAIAQLLKVPKLQVSFVSEVTKSNREKWNLDTTSSTDWEQRILEIRDSFQRLLNLHRLGVEQRSSLSVQLIQAGVGKLRNRFIIFYFAENQAVALSIPHGLEDFSGRKMSEETTFSLEYNPQKVSSLISSWKSSENCETVAEITWIGNSFRSLESNIFPAIRTP